MRKPGKSESTESSPGGSFINDQTGAPVRRLMMLLTMVVMGESHCGYFILTHLALEISKTQNILPDLHLFLPLSPGQGTAVGATSCWLHIQLVA